MKSFALQRIEGWVASGQPIQPQLAVEIKDLFIYAALHTQDGHSEYRIDTSITRAELIVWEMAIWDASTRGSESFIGTSCPTPPEKKQIWVPERPIAVTGEGVEDEIHLAYFVDSYSAGRSGNTVSDFRTKETVNSSKGFTTIDRLGYIGGEMNLAGFCVLLENDPIELPGANTLAQLLFLDEPWINTAPTTLPRPFRRKYERERQPVPEVKTVALRRAVNPGGSSETSSGREYSCQWLVSGHWRKQWYASKGEHAPRYIAPYPKGPSDKPLRASRPTVYHAKR